MIKKQNTIDKELSRRRFLKLKALGGLFCLTGTPLLNLANSYTPAGHSNDWMSSSQLPEEIDWNKIRDEFTFSRKHSFLNTASFGPSPKIVVNTLCDTLKELETMYYDGHWRVADIREKFSQFLNADMEEIAFTRNTTEGMNIAARTLPLKAGDEVILTTHEHVGGAASWLALQQQKGIKIKLIDLDLEGKNNLQIVRDSITDKTRVISFSHITCTTGLILPVKEIVELCRSKGIYSCVDGAQAVGMIPIDLKELNPDFYACSGHKWLLGPKGTGILFINKSVIGACTPVYGGAFSEKNYDLNKLIWEWRDVAEREEYGTRNAPIIFGLGAAADFLSSIGMQNIENRGRELVRYFRDSLADLPGIEILTPDDPLYSASIVTIRINGKDHFQLYQDFDLRNLRIREIHENNMNAMRFSFAFFNQTEDIDFALKLLKEVISN